MKIRKYLYSLNHSWMLLVDPQREDAVDAERKGKLLGEMELDAAHVAGDVEEIRRRLAEHGHCLNHPATGAARQIGATH
ncbi:MAG TPA: hypothetical protein VHQ65_00805 [Thermoanaerobaculia bacterium]|nr:hypothetical protein [Thermoanaerobaculia bacterium]